MARVSPSAPHARAIHLLVGEDPFRARLRLAELVDALVEGRDGAAGDIARRASPELGARLGVTRHDARSDAPALIALSGRAQGLFDAVDERRVVVVEHAEALREHAFLAEMPPGSALVLLVTEQLPRGRRPARARGGLAAKGGGATRNGGQAGDGASPADLPGAVEAAGGVVERIGRLLPGQVTAWIVARATLHGIALAPAAVAALASATGAESERGVDTDRVEQELAKLAAFAGGRAVEAADVRALVSGAIEADVFALTEAVVRRDRGAAVARLEELLADGQAPQQILALLLWQFRVLLFASAMRAPGDAERMAKAIRSSPGALARWQAQARRLSQASITRAYESLYATDLAIKQGRISQDRREDSEAVALMLCVLDLCGVAGADPRELVVGEPPKR